MNSDEVTASRPDDALPASEARRDESPLDGGARGAASETDGSPLASREARPERERSFARRALIQAGWSVPIITGLVFPRNATASASHPFIDHHDFIDRHPGP
jgi:hypothetical protein